MGDEMQQNHKRLYNAIPVKIRLLCESILKIMENDVEEKEYEILAKKINKNKKSLNKLMKLITIIFIVFFHQAQIIRFF